MKYRYFNIHLTIQIILLTNPNIFSALDFQLFIVVHNLTLRDYIHLITEKFSKHFLLFWEVFKKIQTLLLNYQSSCCKEKILAISGSQKSLHIIYHVELKPFQPEMPPARFINVSRPFEYQNTPKVSLNMHMLKPDPTDDSIFV